MYDELVRQMRACCNGEPCEEANCCFNPKSDLDCIEQLLTKAADAIEELSEQLENETEYATALNSYVPQWIPVTEQCPEKSGDYLVFDDCRNLYVNEWHCLLKKWQYDDSRITHWQPLPEPPKEDKP